MAVQSPIIFLPSMPRLRSSASTFSSSLPPGVPVHGSSLVKSSLFPSALAVLLFLLHLIGYGIPSSPSLRLTWLVKTGAISNPTSSSCGEVSAHVHLSTPTSLYPKPKALPLNKWTACSKRPRLAHRQSGNQPQHTRKDACPRRRKHTIFPIRYSLPAHLFFSVYIYFFFSRKRDVLNNNNNYL